MSGAAGKGLGEQDWRPPCQREGSLLSSKERGTGVGMGEEEAVALPDFMFLGPSTKDPHTANLLSSCVFFFIPFLSPSRSCHILLLSNLLP